MSLVLHHHPHSRAATAVWMLEEVGQPYELVWVDLRKGAQKAAPHTALNPMGKVPVLVDGGAVISEGSAIAMYLADRYAPGQLAPAPDAPDRGTWLRWCVFAAAVVEPCCMAQASGWAYNPASAGFGSYDEMMATLEAGIGDGPWLLGEQFTMADVVLGSTVQWMLQFKMLEARPAFVAYAERLRARPAAQRAAARNAAVAAEHGL